MSEPDSEFLEIFRDEARERLDRIVDTLLALESGRADADAVDSLFRDTHTIKGAAGMVGLDDVGAPRARDGGRARRRAPARERFPPSSSSRCCARPTRCAGTSTGDGEPNAELIAELTAAQGVAATVARGRRRTEPVAGRPRARPGAERRSIRVPAEKIDTLLDLVGETVLHRRRLEHELGRSARRPRPALRRARRRRAPARRAQGRRDRHAHAAAVVDRRAAAARRARPRRRDRQAGRARRRRRRDRARPRHPRRALRAARPPAPQRDRARDRGARRSASAPASRSAGASSCAPSSAAASSRSRSPTTAAASPRRRSPRRARTGSLTDVLAQPGFSTAERGQRHLRPRRRARRRQDAGRGLRRQPRGAERARARHAGDPAAAARAGADRGAARRAGRQRLRASRSRASRRWSRSARRCRSAAAPRSSCAAARSRSPTSRSSWAGRRPPPAAPGARSSCSPPGQRIAVDLRRPARQGGGRGQVARAAALARSSRYLGAAILGDGRIALLVDPAALVRASAAPPRRGRRRRRRRADRAEGARRRGLAHDPRAAAQHPRGRRLSRADRARRPRRAARTSIATTGSTSSSPTSRCRRWTASS